MSFEPRLPRDDINASKTHPLADAWWLVIGAAAAGLALTVLALAFAELAARWLPASLEARLFGGLIEAEGDHPRGPAARDLLARLASHWPENPYELRLSVLDEEGPNAFAMPGGSITVTRGLLEQVESENELAFVLGHELGHFAARDHLRAIGRGLILGLVLRAAVGAGAGEAAVPALASEHASRGFARDQERDADAFALQLLAAEYGHVAGAEAFFRRLPDADAGVAQRAAAWLATHPVSAARIAALHDLAARSHLSSSGPLRQL